MYVGSRRSSSNLSTRLDRGNKERTVSQIPRAEICKSVISVRGAFAEMRIKPPTRSVYSIGKFFVANIL